jgi:hypothetical protein
MHHADDTPTRPASFVSTLRLPDNSEVPAAQILSWGPTALPILRVYAFHGARLFSYSPARGPGTA